MYTCCPICKTNFKVSEAQLQVAQGKVRCGSCKNVFNARQHIHYTNTPVSNNNVSQTKTNPNKPVSSVNKQPGLNVPSNKVKTQPNYAKESITSHSSKSPEPNTEAAQTKQKTKQTNPEIDAIFNALDTQLSQGTYDDIAQPSEPDIREAAFNDIFEEDELENLNEPKIYSSQSKTETEENELDLNLIDEEPIETFPNKNEQVKAAEHPSPEKSTPNQPLKETKDKKSSKQQHTFDFINLPDEKNEISIEDQEQLSAVNTPLSIEPTNTLVTKTDNDELHQAIDNIIQVNNSITTPFEENDDDHFVIEMQSEPEVEIVDENQIDKLFASTDNIKVSDLKFDQNQENLSEHRPFKDKTKEQSLTENDSLGTLHSEESIQTEDIIDYQVEDELDNDFENNFGKQSLPDNADESASIDLEAQFDHSPEFEEEIVLSSPELDNEVPARLRDAVASLDQPALSVKKRLFYSTSLIFLIILGLFQLVLFKSTALANTVPVLQPFLVSLCQNLPCRYTGNHNRKQIKIVSRDVRLHPKIKGALLISATIANQADFTQPYPTILLKFTDLTGTTVAQRYFQPAEYLGLLNKPFALMPSKKSIQLNIEILDPGSDAINFQFYFL